MIPKIIHYCWFGRGEMPELVRNCIESWHKYMPDWEFKLWTEDNFDVNLMPYTAESYAAGKYAFVSDVARLWVLREYGGVYLDTDVEVFKNMEPLLQYQAFVCFEGSKKMPIATCVIGTEPHGIWITEQCENYSQDKHFIDGNGHYDMTSNTTFLTACMKKNGFVANGKQQQYKDLTVLTSDFFSPRQTTGEYFFTDNTYCDHLFCASWTDKQKGFKSAILSLFGPKMRTGIIKLKRRLLG